MHSFDNLDLQSKYDFIELLANMNQSEDAIDEKIEDLVKKNMENISQKQAIQVLWYFCIQKCQDNSLIQ